MTLKSETQTLTRRLSACYRHPAEPVTGFCASCLRERLTGLEPSVHPELSFSSTTSTTAFVYSIKNSESGGDGPLASSRRTRTAVPSYFSPDLRRCQSVSVSKCEGSSGLSDPRRKSCDVWAKNTLAHLFDIDNETNGSSEESKVESKNIALSRLTGTVVESREEDGNVEEIRVSEDVLVPNVNFDDNRSEEAEEELKTMKEFIDIELRSRRHNARDFRDISRSFKEAASVFSKKLRTWRQNQKTRKCCGDSGGGMGDDGYGGGDLLEKKDEKTNGRRLRDTQSEIGDYGFRRRSCDTEARFSVDAGRMSVDDPRFSFDEHRASWDGYLIARTIPRLTPMLSAVENVMFGPVNRTENHRLSIDGQMHSINEDETTSGGSAQTDSDFSSSQRRSSFDWSSSVRSCSNRKRLGSEVDEVKSMLNAKVSPANVGVFHGTKLVISEKELKDWHLNSLPDGHSDEFESVSKDDMNVVTGGELNGNRKSSRWQKVCNILSFKHRLGEKKYETFTDVTDHPIADEKQGVEADGVLNGDSSGKLVRSSSVNSRKSCKMVESLQRTGSVVESRDSAKKGIEEGVQERNQSAKYSSGNFENDMLRFYLTPLRSYRSSTKSRPKNTHSVSRNVLRLN